MGVEFAADLCKYEFSGDTSKIGGYMNAQMEQQIVADLRKLDDFRLKEVLDFIAWINRKKSEKKPDKKNILLNLSVWDEADIRGIEEAQKDMIHPEYQSF